METIETNTTKKIGTREEVYKCIASQTAGGLCKSDIIEKNFNGKLIYISKKISDKMKAQIIVFAIIFLSLTPIVILWIKGMEFMKENHPDYNGRIFVSKPGLYYLKGWKKQGKSGQPLLSLAADYAPEDKQLEASENVQERPAFTPNIDDAPF